MQKNAIKIQKQSLCDTYISASSFGDVLVNSNVCVNGSLTTLPDPKCTLLCDNGINVFFFFVKIIITHN